MFPRNRLIRVFFLQYYCIVVLGAPVPLAMGEVDESNGQAEEVTQAFPCAGGMCGCSFEHCWSNCCCHTLAERLDWARKNNVRPPASTIESAIRAGLDVSSWCDSESQGEQHPSDAVASHRHACCKTKSQVTQSQDAENVRCRRVQVRYSLYYFGVGPSFEQKAVIADYSVIASQRLGSFNLC